MSKILVIEAHSDDSAIGAYGYLRKRKLKGDNIYFIAAAMSGVNMIHCGFVPREVRQEEYRNYIRRLGGEYVESFVPFDADSRMDTIPRATIVSAFENVIQETTPDILVLQGPSFHHDHRIVYEAAIAALRPTNLIQPDEILLMENPTYVHSAGPETDFKPNTYCPMTNEEMDEKIDCFRTCFPSQLRSRKNSLSAEGIKAWARYRAIECMTETYAEAFVTFRRKIF